MTKTTSYRLAVILLAMLALGASGTALAKHKSLPGFNKKEGYNWSLTYRQDFMRGIDGGKARAGGAPGYLEPDFHFRWGSSEVKIGILGTFGGAFSERLGVLQKPSGTEAYNTIKLYKLWYGHHFGNTGIALRLGLQTYNSWFDKLKTGAIYLNQSFPVEQTIEQLPVSDYPVTTLGAVLHWKGHGFYAVAGIFDGQPGLPGHPNGTHIDLSSGSGTFSDVEVGLVGKGYKLGIGGWYRTTHYKDMLSQPHDRNHGMYVIASKLLFGGENRPKFDGFVEFGTAQEDRSKLGKDIALGFNLKNFMPGRPKDVLGFAAARVIPSDVFEQAKSGPTRPETSYELTYQLNITKKFFVQPDVQYITNVGGITKYDNAWVIGFRLQYKL